MKRFSGAAYILFGFTILLGDQALVQADFTRNASMQMEESQKTQVLMTKDERKRGETEEPNSRGSGSSVFLSCKRYFIKRSLDVFVNLTIPRSSVTLNLAKYTPLETRTPDPCVEFQVTV